MHTPTPWTTHEGNEGWRITNEHNQTIADCDYGTTEDTNPPTNETKANAALIVKAVNSYEAMRAALERVVAYHAECIQDRLNPCLLSGVFGKHWGLGDACAACTARQALDLAEGKE